MYIKILFFFVFALIFTTIDTSNLSKDKQILLKLLCEYALYRAYLLL